MKFLLLILSIAICLASSLAWDPPLLPGQVCYPGDMFRVDCNTCQCDARGKGLKCTKKLCDIQKPCTHGDTKEESGGCTCISGEWYCP